MLCYAKKIDMNFSTEEFVALDNELRTSIRLIELGFGEIQNLSMGNDFVHLPLQLLSSGIERLLKCILCINYFSENGFFPKKNYLFDQGGNGHNLLFLKNLVLQDAFKAEVPALGADKKFISGNPLLNELLILLTEFGKYSRYHDLNVLLGEEHKSKDVKNIWDQIKNDIYKSHPEWTEALQDLEKSDSAIEESNNHIIKHLEIFIRALVRQFTLGKFSDIGKRFTGYANRFSFIQDKDLGKRNYFVDLNSIKKRRKEIKRRGVPERLTSILNPRYIRKTIRKEDFEDKYWPFYVSEVEIECRESHWLVVTIDGYDYALNGGAQSKYGLPDVHEYGVARKGLSIQKIIDEGFKLCKHVT